MAEAVRWGKRGARVNTISPGIIFTPLAKDELTGPRGYAESAIPAESFARAVAFAISQPEDVDINEILFRPTRQEL